MSMLLSVTYAQRSACMQERTVIARHGGTQEAQCCPIQMRNIDTTWLMQIPMIIAESTNTKTR